jgi:type IV secretion system protein VirB10
VSQQSPPNTPDDPVPRGYGNEESRAPSFAQGKPEERANPYFGAQQPAAPPDLDAGSPVLSAAESRRLNRKALLFLGGILVLLFLLGWFVLRGSDEGGEPAPQARDERPVVVPTLPTTEDEEVPPPVDLAAQPMPEVPPLPVDDDARAVSPGNSGFGEGPSGPSLLERRMSGNRAAGDAGMVPGNAGAQTQQLSAMQAALGAPGANGAAPSATEATSAQYIRNPDGMLVRGTYLRCVLETRIVTDVPGFTSCVVTEPVYSINGRRLLLPKGSKILGRYDHGADLARVAVVWDRVITPNGIDVAMSSPGVDGLGGAGHPGDYDAHWASRITSALLISLISDAFSYAAAENGPETTVIAPGGTTLQQPFQSATARTMERLANQALQKSANRPATVTINQGVVVNVYVAQDVDFSGVLAMR